MENWFAANMASVAATPPGRIDIAFQDPAHYVTPNLLRYRWFNVPGPNGTMIQVLGINLHRGPVYAGLGHAWCKINNALTYEIDCNAVLGLGAPAVVTRLENHAAASANPNIVALA